MNGNWLHFANAMRHQSGARSGAQFGEGVPGFDTLLAVQNPRESEKNLGGAAWASFRTVADAVAVRAKIGSGQGNLLH
jgi:hypothetical protein